VADHYSAANEKAAKLIVRDSVRYGCPDSLMARWARLVIERALPAIKGPLFSERSAA
jgi:hypothetical protein